MRTLLAFLSLILLLSTAGCGEYIGLKATELPVEQATPEDMGGLPDLGTDTSSPSGNAQDPPPEDLFNDDDPTQTTTLPEDQTLPPAGSSTSHGVPPVASQGGKPPATPPGNAPATSQGTPPASPRSTGVDPKSVPPKSKPAPTPTPGPKASPGSQPNVLAGKSFSRTILEMARWVIDNEARKVGPACNFFVQRVLSLLGFARGQWMANQFDIYAKQSFKTYKTKSFLYDTSGEESERLKNYIWSMPERTSFIFQWKQKVGHGHIAFVHRVQNNLVIYHASLNTALPRAQTTEVKTLLHKRRNPYTLNVFSDFTK